MSVTSHGRADEQDATPPPLTSGHADASANNTTRFSLAGTAVDAATALPKDDPSLDATAHSKAFKKHDSSSSNHKSSSSSTTTSSGGGNSSSSPCRIPSLKFPFPWEANKSSTHSRTSRRRAAEQRAALIALGVGGPASSSITPEKKELGGVISLPDEEANSVDLVVPLVYEITRRLVLR